MRRARWSCGRRKRMRSTNEQQSLQMNHSEKVKTAMEEGFDEQEGGGELLLLCTKPFQGLRIIVCEMVTDYIPLRGLGNLWVLNRILL